MPFCPSCGKPVEEGVAFCPSCGYGLNAKQWGTQPPPTSTASPQGSAGAPSRSARPMGVTILAVLEGIGALFELLGGAALLGVGSLMGRYGGMVGSGLHVFLAAIGVILLLVGLATLFVSWGFWTGATWAWSVGMIFALFGALLHFITLPGSLVSLAINVIVLVYLFQPNVKRYFGR
jgi:hypothetical protein